MENHISEFRIVAYFKEVYPSPTQYKRRVYRTIEDANNDFPKAMAFYNSGNYRKHIESIEIQERLVTEWRFINGMNENE